MVRCRRGGVRCPVIYDVGEDWIVMEDVGRVSVKDYLKVRLRQESDFTCNT